MIRAIRLPRLPRKSMPDLRLGFALMRDRRVPARSKILALAAGLGVTALVEFLEIPVESILAMLVPALGLVGDFVLDGAEMVAGPLLLASLLVPYLAPRNVVEQIRSERSGSSRAKKPPVIDI